MLLYIGASKHTGGYFGEGSGPIHLDYVACSGTEYYLTDCELESKTGHSNHSEDVGVKCQTSKKIGIGSAWSVTSSFCS